MSDFETTMHQSDSLSGTLTLSANARPLLKPGAYTVGVTQTFEGHAQKAGAKLSTVKKTFHIGAEQTEIAPEQIYSVYPAESASGIFQYTLPHIILNRRTLPWERVLNPEEEEDMQLPWLALLVFSEDEGVTLMDMTYKEARAHDTLRYDDPQPSDDALCRILRIPAEKFAAVLPAAEDLPYLSHVRDVKLDCKVTDSTVKNGGFACVIANRYPKAPVQSAAVVRHSAYLVSLSGHYHLIKMNKAERERYLSGSSSSYMYTFFSWTFYCEHEEFNFRAACRALDIGLNRRILSAEEKEKLGPYMSDAIERGYTPLTHRFREGSVGVSFYRSPLIAGPSVWENNRFGHYADGLHRYDPVLGLYDTSYSAAWQLGRMLALQNEPLAKEVLTWRETDKQVFARNMNADSMTEETAALTETDSPNMNKRMTAPVEYNESSSRQGDTLAPDEWGAVVPDLTRAAGATERVDLSGSALSATLQKHLQAGAVNLVSAQEKNGVSAQKRLLDAVILKNPT